MRRASVIVLLAALVGLLAAACGGDDTSAPASAPAEAAAPAGPSTEVALVAAADNSLVYDTTTLEAPAGEITIAFANPATVPHNVAVEGGGIEAVFGEIVTEADAPITLSLEPGTYEFFCSVPGHREAGMEGTLIVS